MTKTAKCACLTLSLAAWLAGGSATRAALISHTPGDAVPPVVVSPPFGLLAVGGAAADNYVDFGVDYTYGNVEGVFDDGGALAFGGVDGSSVLDLITAVDGRIVLPGTTTQGLTSYIYAEAGFAAEGSLLLEVFDTDGVLLASAPNGPPLGAFGRTTFTIDRAGVYDIASFRISTPAFDTFGVDEIRIEYPVAVPEPAGLALGLIGLSGAALLRSRLRTRRGV